MTDNMPVAAIFREAANARAGLHGIRRRVAQEIIDEGQATEALVRALAVLEELEAINVESVQLASSVSEMDALGLQATLFKAKALKERTKPLLTELKAIMGGLLMGGLDNPPGIAS